MKKGYKIFTKLFISYTGVVLAALLVLSSIFYVIISDVLIQRTLDQLSSVNILKKQLVENYFLRSTQNLEELQLENKFLHIHDELLQLSANNLQRKSDLTEIDSIRKLYDFQNLYLFDAEYQQLYSTKGDVFSADIRNHIDSVVREKPNHQRLIDVSHFSPDRLIWVYYYIPILRDSQRIGMVLVQENMRKIQNILIETTGMGNSGESYLVGTDYRLRSLSRFFPDRLPGTIKVDTEAARKSFQGQDGNGMLNDYRGVKVLSVYRRIENIDLQWVIISEIDLTEAMKPVLELRNYLFVVTLFIILITAIITYLLSNAIARPILHLQEIVASLSKGIIPHKKNLVTSTDEISKMAEAIDQLTDGLSRTTTFANEIGSGNFSTSFSTLSEKDVLGKALIHMRDELRTFNERELKLARERAATLLEGQENERRRIIKELHDGVGQLLTAIRIRVDTLDSESELKEEIKTRINETIDEVKRISYNVMPQAIVDYGLEAALKGLCDNVKKYSTLTIDFRYVHEHEHSLNFDVSIAIFRIAQEALNNIVKHAQATQVSLHVLDKEDEIYLVIEDNGKGFDESKIVENASFGLRNIRERAKLLNGNADIQSSLGTGTIIEVNIPVV
ncbi:MAG TPA: ATP-binding protein [Cyclobacteriaceae bacterium]|nr:ATP-binding protein [Cyclobacteriaceae bacterium]